MRVCVQFLNVLDRSFPRGGQSTPDRRFQHTDGGRLEPGVLRSFPLRLLGLPAVLQTNTHALADQDLITGLLSCGRKNRHGFIARYWRERQSCC